VLSWLVGSVRSARSLVWVVAVLSFGLIVRSYFLAQPMRYDEAYTYLNFVSDGLAGVFSYPLPNNHVMHTILVKLSVTAFGGHPISIRLPAFFAGILVIPATFCLGRLLIGDRAGRFASALAAVFPFLVLFDTTARGYSMVVLLSLWLAILALRFAAMPSAAAGFLISAVSALGMFTVPSFLFPLAGLWLWIVILLMIGGWPLSRVLLRFALPCGTTTALLGWMLYTPTIIVSNGIHTLITNKFVASLPWAEFLDRLPGHLRHTWIQFGRDVPQVVA
jgi:hypothetical protein